MKKRPITTAIVSGGLALAAILTLHPSFGDETGRIKRSGNIEMSIDPSSPNFSLERTEKNIRENAKAMGLESSQQQQLEDAIKQLRDKVNADKSQGKFNWQFKFNSEDSTPPASKNRSRSNSSADDTDEDMPAPRNQRERLRRQLGQEPGPSQRQGQGSDRFRELFEDNGRNMNPQKLLEEMLKRLGLEDFNQGQGGGNGNNNGLRQFGFQFGEPDQDEGGNRRGNNRFEQLQRMLGGRGGAEHLYNPDTAPRDSKYSRSTLAEYRSTVKEARESTVSVAKDGKQLSLGTVVTEDGYILTKASEVGKGSIECEFMDGKILPAKIVSKLDNYDLALLKVEATGLKPVVWSEKELATGTMLAASGIDEDPISVGVVSVLARNLDESQKGYLGVALAPTENAVGVGISTDGGVVPDGPADKAGLAAGDVILNIDGTDVNHPRELMKIISSKTPGDSVKLLVKGSSGKTEDLNVTLGSRQELARQIGSGIDPTAQMGTNLSGRPSGFPTAITNDLGINANQCGGPVVDIDGNVVGLNIARSGRTSTYMISGKTMKSFLADVTTGKLSVVKDAATLDKEVKKAEAALKAAQDALKSAQDAKEKVGK